MPLHEYVLRREGLADEVLLSDRLHGAPGELVTLRNQLWKVIATAAPAHPMAVDRRILIPADDDRSPRTRNEGGAARTMP